MDYNIVVQGPNGNNRVLRGAQPPNPFFGKLFAGAGGESVAAPNSDSDGSPFEDVASPFQSESVALPQESVAAPSPIGESVATANEKVALFPLLPRIPAPALNLPALPALPALGNLPAFKIPAAAAPAPATNQFSESIVKTLTLPNLPHLSDVLTR